jgi:hypothetical protein
MEESSFDSGRELMDWVRGDGDPSCEVDTREESWCEGGARGKMKLLFPSRTAARNREEVELRRESCCGPGPGPLEERGAMDAYEEGPGIVESSIVAWRMVSCEWVWGWLGLPSEYVNPPKDAGYDRGWRRL